MGKIDFGWFNHDILTIILRLVVAGLLSGVIGLEREVKRHPAGFRTHLLVGVGSCLMMILSIFGFTDIINSSDNIRFDPARLPSYVVSGIGFLGAGTILVHGITVRGLTTAASIWVVSGIGLVVGVGMYTVAIFTTIIVVLSLLFLNKWEHLFIKTSRSETFYLLVENKKLTLSKVLGIMEKHQVTVKNLEVENAPETDGDFMKYHFHVMFPHPDVLPILYDEFVQIEAVHKVFTKE